LIRETAHPDVNLIFGAVIDEKMTDSIRITVIATGFDAIKDQALTPAEESKTLEFPKRTFERDDLDIPAFLRRARQQ